MAVTKLLFAFLAISVIHYVCGDISSDWILFYRNIFSSYNKNIFPREEQSDNVTVKLTYYLNAINNFDEISGVLKTVGFLEVEWENELAAWAEKPRGMSAPIPDTMIPLTDLWHPPITLANSVTSLAELGSNKDLVWAKFSGTHIWRPAVILSSSCSTNPLYFPFDTQKCNLTFRAWDHISSEILLTAPDSKVNLDFYAPSEQWELMDSEVLIWERDRNSYVTFTLIIRRIPLWFIINMAAPIGLLGLLTTFVFLLPIEEGRVGYALGSFLTFSVYLSYIIDSLPKASDPMSYLTIYIVIQVIMSGSVSCISVFTVRLYLKDEYARVPTCLALFIGFICCRFCAKDEFDDIYKPEEPVVKEIGNTTEIDSENEPPQREHMKPESLSSSVKFGVPNIKWKPIDADRDDEEDADKLGPITIPRVGWKMVEIDAKD
ncbi:neuronal acetylcholine receptor subunit alpha-3-like [Saccostrea echinata]|uniref:neuronal acetylcholine receptor subunit alpha-3-like n=1 Tax=Saccostrea echinata TaxID=191078 RepID=UPI002A801087|nr:neuronal acetylcholine receptor subunit alpha-3-like [Saccostrea echinata]